MKKQEFQVCPHCGWKNPLHLMFCRQCENDLDLAPSNAPSKTMRIIFKTFREAERIVRRTTEWWLKLAVLAALIRFIFYGVL